MSRTSADRILVARLTGTARRHSVWREPTAGETTAAVADLQQIAPGRTDLLAEVAGILIGFHDGALDELPARVAAHYCIEAGADPELADRWVGEGRRRAERALLPPFGVKVI